MRLFKRKNYVTTEVIEDLLRELYLDILIENGNTWEEYQYCTKIRSGTNLEVHRRCFHGALDAKIKAAGFDIERKTEAR